MGKLAIVVLVALAAACGGEDEPIYEWGTEGYILSTELCEFAAACEDKDWDRETCAAIVEEHCSPGDSMGWQRLCLETRDYPEDCEGARGCLSDEPDAPGCLPPVE